MTREERDKITSEMARMSLDMIKQMSTCHMVIKAAMQVVDEDYAKYEKKMNDLLKGWMDEKTQH